MSQAGDERLRALRAELRSLGYLKGPLEGWSLGDFLGAPGVGAVRAGVRAAVVGAPLVTIALLIAQAAWSVDPGIELHGLPRVAGLSLLVLFPGVLVVTLGAIALGLSRATEPRHAGRLTQVASALPGIIYVATWWWSRAAPRGGLTLLNLLLLAMIVMVVFQASRLVALVATAVAVERGEAAPVVGLSRYRSASAKAQRATLLAGAGALIVAVALARLLRPTFPMASPLEPIVARQRVAVVAIDGLAYEDLERLDSNDSASLKSAAVLRLDPGPAGSPPPLVWTTMATGRHPIDHGVASLLVERIPGFTTQLGPEPWFGAARRVLQALSPRAPRRIPVSEALRREKSFFEVASEAGLEVVVANWWATHPASIARGSVISDRALATLLAGGEIGHGILPLAWGQMIQHRFATLYADLGRDLAGWFSSPVTAAVVGDRIHRELALDRFIESRADVVVIYLQGADVLWSEHSPAEPAAVSWDRELEEIANAVAAVGRALGDSGPLVVIGHPGRSRPRSSAVLLIAGDGVQTGSLADGRIEDVAPTLLACLGVPLSAELEGSPHAALLGRCKMDASAPRTVLSYGRREREAVGEFDPSTDAARERLRALGYVNE